MRIRAHYLIKRLSGSQTLSNLMGLRSKEGYENLLKITSMISSHVGDSFINTMNKPVLPINDSSVRYA